MYADIAVIGGGASGITAAISAKKTAPDAVVVIAERLDRTGKKILSTGSGRCNLSNRDLSGKHYHGSVKNVMETIGDMPSAEELFAELGVPCITDEQGRMYPRSESAASVVGALRIKLGELGITEKCGFDVVSLDKFKDGYKLTSSDGETISCRRVIIAAGGYAAPKMGTDGSVMRLLRDRGYKIAKICPALAPLRTAPESLKGLKGVRAKGMVSAVSGGKILKTERGEIQFTENSVSGICVFDLSRFFGEYEGKLKLRIDLADDISESELAAYIRKTAHQRKNRTAEELLTGLFTRPLAIYIVKNTLKIPMSSLVSELSKDAPELLAKRIKSLEFDVTGCSPWGNAQVTAGGIHGSCVDEKLASRLEKGVYLCGEILDVDGGCGGYNLQWAWSSGMLAGRSCALSLGGGNGR